MLFHFLKLLLEVSQMNKKEAVAYAQITFESMMHSDYTGELSVANFGIEMRQAFKLYPKNIVLNIAESKIYAENKLKNRCDASE